MPLSRPGALVVLCLLALLLPAGAAAHHRDSHEVGWEGWRPDLELPEEEQEEAGADENAWLFEEEPEEVRDDAAWFDDLQQSGDERPSAPARRKPGKRPATRPTGSRTLRGVPYRTLIIRHARRRDLEPALVAAVVHAESNFRPRAVSRVGARGLMQLMPATARGMGAAVRRLFDPATNISYGTLYLAQVRRIVRSDVRMMAAAYNAGPGAVRRYRGVPPYAETRAYVRRVTALRARYRR